ncbi:MULTISPECIES: hypothetical protein [unclassified Lysobacter]|uniref:hypothetical protein n=1 Tax=unclassified Lysobacter TaxID=2635362 RepID=UPI0012FA1F0B|nr:MULTISPECIES: hypothetical protein [unclassified Lysobacter]
MVEKSDFFHDLAVVLDAWSQTSTDSLTADKADLLWMEEKDGCIRMREAFEKAGVESSAVRAVLNECFRGLLVSALSIIDGATEMVKKGRVHLVNEDGEPLGEGLHQEFVNYLFDTVRLK